MEAQGLANLTFYPRNSLHSRPKLVSEPRHAEFQIRGSLNYWKVCLLCVVLFCFFQVSSTPAFLQLPST